MNNVPEGEPSFRKPVMALKRGGRLWTASARSRRRICQRQHPLIRSRLWADSTARRLGWWHPQRSRGIFIDRQ